MDYTFTKRARENVMSRNINYILVIFIFLPYSLTAPQGFKAVNQAEGPGQTNCYLLYDLTIKDAAVFDVAGPLDSLISIIKEKDLSLRYIFLTHAHWDHVEGLFDLKDKFPDAKVCLTKEEYLAMQEYALFAKESDPERFEKVMRDSALAKMMSFDLTLIHPDIFLKDNEEYKLGNLKIRTIFSPGHSAGSICFMCGNILFSGDVLFYRAVGNTDFYSASRADQIQSVRRLYNLLPDSTIVYPGHGQFTDIGSEKKENKYITVDNGKWDIR